MLTVPRYIRFSKTGALTRQLSQQFIPPTQPTTTGRQLPTSIPLPVLPAVEAAKRLAAFAAVDQNIELEHRVRCGHRILTSSARIGAHTVPDHWSWVWIDCTICGGSDRGAGSGSKLESGVYTDQ